MVFMYTLTIHNINEGELFMKKSLVLVLCFLMFLVNSVNVSAFTNSFEVIDQEPNNSKDLAQVLPLEPSYDYEGLTMSIIKGTISSINDVDWYVVTLPEVRGSFVRDMSPIIPLQPGIKLFGINKDGVFADITYEDTSHLSGKQIYIQVKPLDELEVRNYEHRFYFGANPLGTSDIHEPNDKLNMDGTDMEIGIIESGKLVETKWNTRFDNIDNFAIQGQGNKGVLSFQVQYSQSEYEHWVNYNIDHYLTYGLYAQNNDGTLTKVWGKSQIGMPNQTFSHSLEIDNTKFNGKYILQLRSNYKKDPNYKVLVDFEATIEPTPEPPVTEPEPEPVPPSSPDPTPEPANPQKTTQRFFGDTRYTTNINLNSQIPEHTLDHVIIADGRNFPDALAGGVLNNTLNGTIMLVNNNTEVIQEAIKESKRLLKPTGKVYILGGTGVVSVMVESEFKKHFHVMRLAGEDRIATALEVAKKANAKPGELILAYGYDFADALSIVPYATEKNIPILLTNKNNLDDRVKEYIQKNQVKKVTIVGGVGVVSTNIEKNLSNMGVTTQRISGDTRFTTALAVANKFYSGTVAAGIANGYSFADALSGSRLAYDKKMPILLVKSGTVQEDVKVFLQNRQERFVLGGNGVISEKVLSLIN